MCYEGASESQKQFYLRVQENLYVSQKHKNKTLLKIAFNWGIILDLQKSCKESSHLLFTQLPQILTFYTTTVHLSKLRNRHWDFTSSNASVPLLLQYPVQSATLVVRQASPVSSDLWLFLMPSLVFCDLETFDELLVRCLVEWIWTGVCLMDHLNCDALSWT